MTLLVDSSVLIGHLRGDAACTAFLVAHVDIGTDLRVSGVSWAELLAGASLDAAGEDAVLEFLGMFTPAPVTAAVGTVAGRLLRAHAGARGLRMADALIAATAVELDCPVATLDQRHLGAVPGLVVVEPRRAGAG